MSKFSSYAFTVRPRDGISDGDLQKFTTWAIKRSLHYYIVTEKTGHERHIHAGLIFRKELMRSNVCTLLKQLFKDWSVEEIRVLFNGVKVMYNNDFINKYMAKGDDTVVIAESLPEAGHLEKYFPARTPPKELSHKHSLKFHELEQLWYQHVPTWKEINPENCRHFLYDIMYNKRIYPVLECDKKKIQLSRNLSRWLKKESECLLKIDTNFENDS